MKRGVVSSRVALLLRSTETQPQLLDLKQNSSSISFSFLIPVKIILEGIHKRNPTDSHEGPGKRARERAGRPRKGRKIPARTGPHRGRVSCLLNPSLHLLEGLIRAKHKKRSKKRLYSRVSTKEIPSHDDVPGSVGKPVSSDELLVRRVLASNQTDWPDTGRRKGLIAKE